MSVVFRVINSLEKVFPNTVIEDLTPIDCNVRMLMNDRFSFQIAYRCDGYLKESKRYCLHIESSLDCLIQQVVCVPSNLPRRGQCDDGYLFSTPAMVPDLLLPSDGHFKIASYLSSSFFCTLSTSSCCYGKHEVKISVRDNDDIEVYESIKGEKKPFLMICQGGEECHEAIKLLREHNIPSYPTAEQAVNAMVALYHYGTKK